MRQRRLRIGLDARAADPVPSGLTTYSREIVRAITFLDQTNTYIVMRRPNSGPPFVLGPTAAEVVIRGDAASPTRGSAMNRLGLDLYHGLHHFLPFALHVPHTIVTLHDLLAVEHQRLARTGRFTWLTRGLARIYASAAMRHALHGVDRIIAVSSHTRERAIAHFTIDPGKCAVVYPGVALDRFHPADASWREPDAPYFLCVGNTRPYKNIPTAIRAFARCQAAIPDAQLVIAGRGDHFVDLQLLATRLGIAERVRFVGQATEPELLGLLHGATALIFPSKMEGFGLPVIEAAAAGCPVIASSFPAVREAAGDAAIVCDPECPDQFADAMIRLATDREARLELRARGLARASLFDWSRCARETLAIYESVAAAPVRRSVTRRPRPQPHLS
jgi:glycosyltransferase involved in cell wall biosynthesis